MSSEYYIPPVFLIYVIYTGIHINPLFSQPKKGRMLMETCFKLLY